MTPQDLINTLIEQGVISEEQLSNIPEESRQNIAAIERALQEQGLATKQQLLEAKSAYYGVPYIDVTGRKIPSEVLKLVPENTVERYGFVPLERSDDELVVGMVDPGDVDAREALKFVAVQEHVTPKIYLISQEGLEDIAGQYSSLGKEVGKALQELEQEIQKNKRRARR